MTMTSTSVGPRGRPALYGALHPLAVRMDARSAAWNLAVTPLMDPLRKLSTVLVYYDGDANCFGVGYITPCG